MQIVDRIMLGQNKYLAIAEIQNKFYLISITEKNINILKKLEDFEPIGEEISENPLEFNKLLDKFLKNNQRKQ